MYFPYQIVLDFELPCCPRCKGTNIHHWEDCDINAIGEGTFSVNSQCKDCKYTLTREHDVNMGGFVGQSEYIAS